MTTLTAAKKSHIQHVLAQINLWLKQARDKLQQVEDEGAAFTPGGHVPDFGEANVYVRTRLRDSIIDKSKLIESTFPDHETAPGHVIRFEELYDLLAQLDQIGRWLIEAVDKVLAGQEQDAFFDELDGLADLIDFFLRELRAKARAPWRDAEGKRLLEDAIAELERFVALLREVRRRRSSPWWRPMAGTILRLLRRKWRLFERAWRAWLGRLGDARTFPYWEVLTRLRMIDRILDEIRAGDESGLPYILPSIESLGRAMKYKHEIEELINAAPTSG